MNAPTSGVVKRAVAIILLVAVAGGGWYLVLRQEEARRREQARAAQRLVASDAMMLYAVATRAGHKVDACMYAGRAAAALERANDDSLHAAWKSTEEKACKTLGFPF